MFTSEKKRKENINGNKVIGAIVNRRKIFKGASANDVFFLGFIKKVST